jgi:hypothetical protein
VPSCGSVQAHDRLVTCPVPRADPGDLKSTLEQALAANRALQESYLCRQIVRLGRMSAYERLVDWLLEIRSRLRLSGHDIAERFEMPMSQELLGDALGLTSVHINRVIKTLREDRLITISGRIVTLHDVAALKRVSGYDEFTPVEQRGDMHPASALVG